MVAEDRYILILAHGELSLAEAVSYIESEGLDYNVVALSRQAAVLEADGFEAGRAVGRLGGLYKVGRVTGTLGRSEAASLEYVKGRLDSGEFYDRLEEKASWCISIFGGGFGVDSLLRGLLREYFGERLRRDGVRKARYIHPGGPRGEGGAGEEIFSEDVVRRGILDRGFEVLVASMPDGYYIASTLAVFEGEGYRRRDLDRPVQRPILSMPPRIARVLVNLTGVAPGETLLDPFCGVGTVLQEAAVLGIDVLGSDIDKRRVSETVRNLKWLSDRYRLKIGDLDRRVFRADARRLSRQVECVDGIATEPILLPPLRRYPAEEEAEAMLEESGLIYAEALSEMAPVLKKRGRLALIVPYVKTRGGREVSFRIEDMIRPSGFRPYHPSKGPKWSYPLMASPGRGQKVLRGVYVLERV